MQSTNRTTNHPQVGEFELVDHGICDSSFFQGCGVSFTPYSECTTGVGSNADEALDNLCEMVAQMGYDTDPIGSAGFLWGEDLKDRILADAGIESAPTTRVCDDCGCRDSDDDDLASACDICERHYFLSLRWNPQK